MKKSVWLLLILAGACLPATAQKDSTEVEKMGNLLGTTFANTNKELDFIDRLSQSFQFLLTDSVSPALSVINNIGQKAGIALDSAVQIFVDSSLAAFRRQHVWDENADLKERFEGLMTAYSNAICPCLQQRTEQTGKIISPADVTPCLQGFQKDTATLKKFREVIGTLSPTDQPRVLKVINQFLFQQCQPIYQMMGFSGSIEATGEYAWQQKKRFQQFTRLIIALREKNSPQLAAAFPAYKNFLADIDAVVKLNKNPSVNFYNDLIEEKNGVATRSELVHLFEDTKPVLFGEVVYTVARYPSFKMLTYRFTPAAKMKDKKRAMDLLIAYGPPPEPPPMMEELPPPPPPRPKKDQ